MGSIIVGLDIGSSCIRVVIGQITLDNSLEVIGFAKRPSLGVRNGVIVRVDQAIEDIQKTIDDAEQNAGVDVKSVYTAIGGSQVESRDSSGPVGVDTSGKNRPMEINENTKSRAIDSAKAVVYPLDKEILHVIPQKYIVDGSINAGKNPIGMRGVRLEAFVHLVYASVTAYSSIEDCVKRSGYNVDGIKLKTLAASVSCVHEDEMDLGSIIIDLGAGSTDVMVLNEGAPVFTASIPVGGNLVTSDIAMIKGISNQVAEKIKVENGCCWITGNQANEEVIIPGVGIQQPEAITRYELCQIIQPRVEEIMSLVRKEVIHGSKLENLSGSIVLTGGGALMDGIVELTQSVWGTSSVRIGCTPDFGCADDSYRDADYATAVGLLILAKDENASAGRERKVKLPVQTSGKKGRFREILDKFF